MVEKNDVVFIGKNVARVTNVSKDSNPLGEEEVIVSYRYMVMNKNGRKELTKLESEERKDVGGNIKFQPVHKLADIGIHFASCEDAMSFLGMRVYVSSVYKVGRIVYIDKDVANKQKVTVAFIAEGSHSCVSSYKDFPLNEVFPLVDGVPVVICNDRNRIPDKKAKIGFVVQDRDVAISLVCVRIPNAMHAAGEETVFLYKNIHIPKLFLDKRTESTIVSKPLIVYRGNKCVQNIYKNLPPVESRQFKIGNLVSFKYYDYTLVGEIVEIPDSSNGYYLGVKPVSKRFHGNIVLNSGVKGVYINPKNVYYLTIGFLGDISGCTFDTKNLFHRGKNLSGKRCRVLRVTDYTNAENLLKPVLPRKDALVEFFEEIEGAHSGDGIGSPGKCLVVNTVYLSMDDQDINEIKSIFSYQRELFVTPDAPQVLNKILDKLDLNNIKGALRGFLESGKIDVENITGIVCSNPEVTIAENINQLVCINGYVVPLSCIKFITEVKDFEPLETGLRDKLKLSGVAKSMGTTTSFGQSKPIMVTPGVMPSSHTEIADE